MGYRLDTIRSIRKSCATGKLSHPLNNSVFHVIRYFNLPAFFALLCVLLSASGQVWSADLAGDYNQGIEQYQQSKFDEAIEFFGRAAASSDDSLAAKARYNLGNSLYAKANDKLRQSNENQNQPTLSDTAGANLQTGAETQDQTSPIDLLAGAVTAYRSSLRLNPSDEDARFNLENATRLIDQLKEQESDQKSPSQQKDPNQQKDPTNRP